MLRASESTPDAPGLTPNVPFARVHTPGRVNENWPLCREVEALQRGWTVDEIEDGELPDDPVISGEGDPERPWFVCLPASCRGCLELVHA